MGGYSGEIGGVVSILGGFSAQVGQVWNRRIEMMIRNGNAVKGANVELVKGGIMMKVVE